MASITMCNVDEGLERRLRIRAAENGRIMEQEACEILMVSPNRWTTKWEKLGASRRMRGVLTGNGRSAVFRRTSCMFRADSDAA